MNKRAFHLTEKICNNKLFADGYEQFMVLSIYVHDRKKYIRNIVNNVLMLNNLVSIGA
jgi:hypothetical protein